MKEKSPRVDTHVTGLEHGPAIARGFVWIKAQIQSPDDYLCTWHSP